MCVFRRKNASQHGHGPVNTNGPQGAGGPGQTLRKRERGTTTGKCRVIQLQGPITAGPRNRLSRKREAAEKTRRRQLVNTDKKKTKQNNNNAMIVILSICCFVYVCVFVFFYPLFYVYVVYVTANVPN